MAPVLAGALLAQVASALDTAHAAGLVHRDVKPHNVLVDSAPGQPEHAFLSDFGISKGIGFETGLTATGQFVGTPGFCAPEQIKGACVDGRADQYALGCVAFVLLTGEILFRRGDTMAMLYAHVHDPAPPLSSVCPGSPASRRRRRDRTSPGEVAGRPLPRVRRFVHRPAGGAVQARERDNRRRSQRWPQREHVRPGPRSRTGEGSWHLGRWCGRRTRRGRRGGSAAPCSVSWTRASYRDAVPAGPQPGTFRACGQARLRRARAPGGTSLPGCWPRVTTASRT